MSELRFVIFLLLVVGIIVFQVFLSKRESRWPGLILPILSFLYSFLYPLNFTATADGTKVGLFLQILVVFLLGNLPTILLLGIYFGCREKQRTKKQLDRMNVQDLDE